MLKNIILTALLATLATGFSHAQEAAPASHKSHDQKMRDCRKQATDLNLQGEERRSFVAQCMKRPTR
jgi:hypothetical protein